MASRRAIACTAQLGARLRRCHCRWNWEATGKAGIYGNDMEQIQAPIIDFPDFEFRSGQGSDDGGVAFVGDLNLTGIYQLNRIWGLRVGYNLIWIEGVALAPDQLDFTNTPDSGSDLDGDGGVFLHGVNVGFEARRQRAAVLSALRFLSRHCEAIARDFGLTISASSASLSVS